MTRLRLLALVLLPTLALSACDSGGDEATGDPEVGGTYVGTYADGEDTATLTLDVDDTDGGAFDFDGTLRFTLFGQNGTAEVEGTGEYDYPRITFTATYAGQTETIEGTVSADADTITAEFEGAELVLERQD